MTIRTTARALLAIGLLSPLVALAQQPRPDREDPIHKHLFPPELIMSNQNAIGLDQAQKEAIRAEILEAQTRFTELQWKLHDAMEMLGSLLEQEPTDEEAVMAHLDQLLDTEREVKRAQLTLMIRLKNALEPEQRERLRELRPEMPRERN